MKTYQNPLSLKYIIIYLIILLVIVPLIINFFIDIPNPFASENSQLNETHWLTFLGGYLGASLSILATLFVLRVTLKNHNDLKLLQINTIQFNHQQQRLDVLKKQMEKVIRSIDLQTFVEVKILIKNNSLVQALLKLNRIVRNVEFQTIISDLYRIDESIEKDQYTILSKRMIEDYGSMVTDMIFLTKVLLDLPVDGIISYDSLVIYTNGAKEELLAGMILLKNDKDHIAKSTEIFNKIIAIDKNKDVISEVKSIYYWVFSRYKDVYSSKQKLFNAMQVLIETESKRINELLLPSD